MAKPPRRALVALACLVLVLSLALAACGGSDDDAEFGVESSSDAVTHAVQPTSASGQSESEQMAISGASEAPAADGSRPDLVANTSPVDRHVIRTAHLTLTVADVEQGLAWVRDLSTQRGGFVFGSSSYLEDGFQYAQITIKVPSDVFDSVVAELRGAPFVVKVDREEASSEDVSAEYVDNESRLKALQATELRFLALLAEADDVDEILSVEYELNNIRAQIETIKGRQQYLDEMTAFATVSVSLSPEGADSLPDDDDEQNFIARVFGDTWDNAREFLEGMLVFTFTAGIVVLSLAPFALLAWFIYRLVRRRLRPTSVTTVTAGVPDA